MWYGKLNTKYCCHVICFPIWFLLYNVYSIEIPWIFPILFLNFYFSPPKWIPSLLACLFLIVIKKEDCICIWEISCCFFGSTQWSTNMIWLRLDPRIRNYIHELMWDVITHSCPNFNNLKQFGLRAWMSNYIPVFYMDVITYPCPIHDVGFAYLCW